MREILSEQEEFDLGMDCPVWSVEERFRIHKSHVALRKENERLRTERDTLKQEAQIWRGEARAHEATVQEAYQHVTQSSGEPGTWHGAKPIERLAAENERLRDIGKQLMQEVYDRSQGYPIPEHHCGFEHHPDEGYCKFHEEWVDIAMALDPAILDEWAEDEVAE